MQKARSWNLNTWPFRPPAVTVVSLMAGLTGLAGSFLTLFLVRLMLGFGEGATFPVATRAMQAWTPPDRRGFAQGLTHAFSRVGNSITPPLVAALIGIISWRGSFVVLGLGSFAWDAAPGEHELCCRATDGARNVQPLEPAWNYGGFCNNAVQRIRVTVSAG